MPLCHSRWQPGSERELRLGTSYSAPRHRDPRSGSRHPTIVALSRPVAALAMAVPQRLRFSCWLVQWLAATLPADSWGVTIDSADDIVCTGAAGFSKFGPSILVCTCGACAPRDTEARCLRPGMSRRRSGEHAEWFTQYSRRVPLEVSGIWPCEERPAGIPLCCRLRLRAAA